MRFRQQFEISKPLKVLHFEGFLILLFFLILSSACRQLNPWAGASQFKQAKIILDSIPLYPGMTQVNESKASGFGKAFVSKSFRSIGAYQDVKRFYYDYLSKEGCRFDEECSLKDWGQDVGGRHLTYRKDEYEIKIQYSGGQADYGWQYAISANWRGSG